jgi:hypothetical protein
MEAHPRAVEAESGALEGLFLLVVADSHHICEESEMDPVRITPHHCEKSDPDSHQRDAYPKHRLCSILLLSGASETLITNW